MDAPTPAPTTDAPTPAPTDAPTPAPTSTSTENTSETSTLKHTENEDVDVDVHGMFKVNGTVRMTPEMLKALESASNRNGTGDMQVNISVSADPAEMSMSTKSVNISVSAEPVKNMFTKP